MELGNSGRMDMENNSIILDIGMDFTKIGFSKDPIPRFILKTPLSISSVIRSKEHFGITVLADLLQDTTKLKQEIQEFLYEIFTVHCLVKTTGNTVWILEQLIFPRKFMQALAEVLFLNFEFEWVYIFSRYFTALRNWTKFWVSIW